MYQVHTEQHAGFTIKIAQDTDAQNPLEDFDMFGTFYHWHRRGFVGTDMSRKQEEMQELIDRTRNAGGIIIPVFLYEHSGQTISAVPFSCPWDSGTVGVWIATPEEIRKEYDAIDDAAQAKATELIKSQIKTVDDYLTGNIYGFMIEDAEGNDVDSCWGFYGDYNAEGGALAEAKSIAEHYARKARRDRQDLLKRMIWAGAPLEVRAAKLKH